MGLGKVYDEITSSVIGDGHDACGVWFWFISLNERMERVNVLVPLCAICTLEVIEEDFLGSRLVKESVVLSHFANLVTPR